MPSAAVVPYAPAYAMPRDTASRNTAALVIGIHRLRTASRETPPPRTSRPCSTSFFSARNTTQRHAGCAPSHASRTASSRSLVARSAESTGPGSPGDVGAPGFFGTAFAPAGASFVAGAASGSGGKLLHLSEARISLASEPGSGTDGCDGERGRASRSGATGLTGGSTTTGGVLGGVAGGELGGGVGAPIVATADV